MLYSFACLSSDKPLRPIILSAYHPSLCPGCAALLSHSDVVGGAFLGSGIALLYFFRAVPRHRRLDAVDEGDAELAPVPLLGGEGGATPPAHAASSEMV